MFPLLTRTLCLFAFAAFAAQCLGQTGSGAEQPAPQQQFKRVGWTPSCKTCDAVYVDGNLYRSVTAEGLSVGAAIKDTGAFLRAHVIVSNKTSQRVTVRPEIIKLFIVAPKTHEVAYVTPEKVARRVVFGAEMANAIDAGVAAATAQQTQTTSQSTTTGSVSASGTGGYASGTYRETTTTTTTTSPKIQPGVQAQLQANAQRRLASANVTADDIIKNSLKANTLMAGEEIDGWVYFQRDKKAEGVVLLVILDDQIFELPFHFEKKNKK